MSTEIEPDEQDSERQIVSQQVLALYDKAWRLEKEAQKMGIKRPKSEIFLSREILELLIELQDDYSNDGSSMPQKLKQKKLNLVEKYVHKLHSNKHIELLTDCRNRTVLLLLIAVPCKQSTQCMTYLVEDLQCSIETADHCGQNGYHIACQHCNVAAIQLLYKHNLDITQKDTSSEQLSPLHIALDLLISAQKNEHSTNTHKFERTAKLCCTYAILQGQDLIHDTIAHKNGGGCWNIEHGQSIMDVAHTHFGALTVVHDAYMHGKQLFKIVRTCVLRYDPQCDVQLVKLLWSFMYSALPKLDGVKKQLEQAKQRLADERLQRRQSQTKSARPPRNTKMNQQQSTASKTKKTEKIETKH